MMFAVKWSAQNALYPGIVESETYRFDTRKAAETYIRRNRKRLSEPERFTFELIELPDEQPPKRGWGRVAAQLTIGLLLGSATGSGGPLGGPYGD